MVAWLSRLRRENISSVITEMYLLSYPLLEAQHEKQIQSFLSEVVIVDLSNKIKQMAIQLRRVYGLKLSDAIIAATAMAVDAELLTNDRKLQSVSRIKVRALILKKAVE